MAEEGLEQLSTSSDHSDTHNPFMQHALLRATAKMETSGSEVENSDRLSQDENTQNLDRLSQDEITQNLDRLSPGPKQDEVTRDAATPSRDQSRNSTGGSADKYAKEKDDDAEGSSLPPDADKEETAVLTKKASSKPSTPSVVVKISSSPMSHAASDRYGKEDPSGSEGASSKSGPKSSVSGSVITIADTESKRDHTETVPAPKKRPSSSRLRMEKELSRMAEADKNLRLREKDKRKREVAKAVSELHERKRIVGVTLTQDAALSLAAVSKIVKEEEKMALEKDQIVLKAETDKIKAHIDDKYGLKDKKQGHDLLTLTEKFYHDNVKDDGLTDSIRRELTRSEIKDLKMVFDMFDMKGRGYITANDVKRAAGMLGFKAKKEVFTEMIEEVTGNKRGQVTFLHFLQFVVKGQGEGEDPVEDIQQGFRLLDEGQKGYVTSDDLRRAADGQKIPLSNRAIREMIQEADMKGDGKITAQEFVQIMLQTSIFRTAR